MILHGTTLHWNGHGECGLLSVSFLPSHLSELSVYLILRPMGPMRFACPDTPPHIRSVAWQGGMYVHPRSQH